MSTISERILFAISKAQLSYSELSELTKIPKAALQRYATGVTPKIPLDRLELIANATNVSPQYLMGWEEEPKLNLQLLGEENHTEEPKLSKKNKDDLPEDVIIYHRDGKTVRKQFTKEQMDLLLTMINAIPEKPKDI